MTKLLRRLRRAPHRTVDRLIALAVLIAGELELLIRYGGDSTNLLPHVAVLGFAYLALAFRRTHPLATAVAVLGSWVFVNVALTDLENLQIPLLAVLMVAYALGAYTRGYRAIAAPILLFAGMMAIVSTFEDQVFTDFVFPTAFALVVWLGARYLAARTQLVEEVHEAAVRAQEADEEAAAPRRRRARADRPRAPRRHRPSGRVMVVQAGGARGIVQHDPGAAPRPWRGRGDRPRGDGELRSLLDVLHQDDADARRSRPRGSTRSSRARRRRLDVGSRRGRAARRSGGHGLAAYRVVQEALTNAMRHAGAAPTEVTVRYDRRPRARDHRRRAASRRSAETAGMGSSAWASAWPLRRRAGAGPATAAAS